jgi:hypothetical protein
MHISLLLTVKKEGVSIEVFSSICCFCLFVFFITEVLILLPSAVLLYCPVQLNTDQMINPKTASRSQWPVVILP